MATRGAVIALCTISTLLVLMPTAMAGATRIASVVLEGNHYVVKEGVHKGWIASGNFTDHIQETGWSFLTIDTNGSYSDLQQAYAAGYLEGNLTAKYIRMYWNNIMDDYCSTKTKKCSAVNDFLMKNSLWMLNNMNSFPNNIYWHQVRLLLQQLLGLETAYYGLGGHLGQKLKLNIFGLLLLQISVELEDIESILGFEDRKEPLGSGSCSALVKLLPDFTDLLVAHDTWTHYNEMLRVIKKYNLSYRLSPQSKNVIPGREIAFTSYPGVLQSVDDFYVTGSDLVVMETTIGNSNADLWRYSSPDNLLAWLRVTVALRVANDAPNWVEIFRKYNMGTYNNQWMVVDYSKFTPGQAPRDGLLLVAEQLPGYIEAKDFTSMLSGGSDSYWASYNLPYFQDIYNLSGTQQAFQQYGNIFSYEDCPRAKMFQRNQTDVVDVESLLRLMRYNDFQHDPLAACNCTPPYSGENAISARSDLNPANGTYYLPMLQHRCHGGIDAKIISSGMVNRFSFLAVSGPTADQQPPFQWSTSDFRDTYPHEGLPDKWDFSPVQVTWNTLVTVLLRELIDRQSRYSLDLDRTSLAAHAHTGLLLSVGALLAMYVAHSMIRVE